MNIESLQNSTSKIIVNPMIINIVINQYTNHQIMKRSLYLFVVIIILNPLSAQDFTKVDAHAMRIKAGGNLTETVNELTIPFDSEMEQVRSIFTWIATNVSYDCKEFHRKFEDRKAKTRPELRERSYSKQTAICAGYAILFDEMCEIAGINAEYISGYARISPRPPSPDRLNSNHAWNAVEIDGKWYLLDATWAAGYTDGELKKFTFHFDDRYFMTDPEQFFQRHWPEDTKWQLMDETKTEEDFSDLPHFHKLFPDMHLHSYFPASGILDEDAKSYHFRIQLEGADQVYLRMGTRMLDMEKKEDNFYEYTMTKEKFRGRKIMVAARKGDWIRGVVEYRLR